MIKHKYITRAAHAGHPAGSECLAWREHYGSVLVIEFSNGDRFEVEGQHFYLEGIEEPRSLVQIEDDRALAMIDEAVAAVEPLGER